MRITTLRSISKINSNVYQNFRRPFSFKFEMTPANRLASETTDEARTNQPEESKPEKQNFRYNVCQPRTSPVERSNIVGDILYNNKQSVKAAIQEQQLQPSMLPEYYQKHMEKSALTNPEPEFTEGGRINKGQNPINQRRFQVSKTYANAILPLKSVKLANPFPEPVKMMMSRTVSDDEKAEQMLAESRSQRTQTEWNTKSNFRSFSTEIKRWYSKSSSSSVVGGDPDKCKKFKRAKQEKGCPRMHLANCPPRVRTKCDRLAKEIHCKKQEAPYPAYSEFCHEDPDEKPSECKLCPWKPEENPNFKPQKKNLHTSGVDRLRRSGLEMDRMEEELTEERQEGMRMCDLRKPPCERPKNRRCPPKEKEEKKKKVEEVKKKPPKKEECSSQNNNIKEEFLILDRQPAAILTKNKEEKGHHPDCKIKKFPFLPCETTKKKEEEKQESGCPKKKRKKKIYDCPPSDDKAGCHTLGNVMEEFSLSGIEEEKGGEKKQQCPKVDLTTSTEERDEDPCNLKKRGTTKICPGDLLKKKRKGRKPPKKTSGMITPAESITDLPQPSGRV